MMSQLQPPLTVGSIFLDIFMVQALINHIRQNFLEARRAAHGR